MEYDQEAEGAIDVYSEGSTFDFDRLVGEIRDIGLRDSVDGDEGQLDDKDSVPEPIQEDIQGPSGESRPEPTYRPPVKDFGEVLADKGIQELIDLGWRPTEFQIGKFREIIARGGGSGPKPGFSARVGAKRWT